MLSGSRQKRVRGASPSLRVVPAAPEVTLVTGPVARRETRGRGQLYLERASLIAMTEKPVIVMSRPLPGEQTQIVRRPVRKAAGRRWIFIFGGAAAMATLLAAWLGPGHRPPAALLIANPVAAGAPSAPSFTTMVARPIVAPLAENAPAIPSVPVASARRAVRPVTAASGRHSRPARVAAPSRLAAHRPPSRPALTTVAWVDPFVDR